MADARASVARRQAVEATGVQYVRQLCAGALQMQQAQEAQDEVTEAPGAER